MDAHDAGIEYKVPPQPHQSRLVRDGVARFARSHGVGEDDLAAFLSALGEALANAVEHAGTHEPVYVEVRVGQDKIVATVQDNWVGFASAHAIVESELPCAESERGRGLPIMRRYSDIFAVESRPGNGTAVVLGRYLRKGRTAAAEVA